MDPKISFRDALYSLAAVSWLLQAYHAVFSDMCLKKKIAPRVARQLRKGPYGPPVDHQLEDTRKEKQSKTHDLFTFGGYTYMWTYSIIT